MLVSIFRAESTTLSRVSKNVFVIHILPKFKAISWNIDAASVTIR